MMLNTILFYVVFSSALLMYGTGIRQIFEFSNTKNKNIWLLILRVLITTVISIAVCRGISMLFLVPARLQELFPFVCILFTYLISLITEKLFEYVFKRQVKEIAFTVSTVLLAINEGMTMAHSLIIGISCILSACILLPVLVCIRKRIDYSQQQIDFRKAPLVFLSIAIILMVLFAINVSWLNEGVL